MIVLGTEGIELRRVFIGEERLADGVVAIDNNGADMVAVNGPEPVAVSRSAHLADHDCGIGEVMFHGIQERTLGLFRRCWPSSQPVARPSQKLPPRKIFSSAS